MKNNNKRGFTLIELLIVIGIIAILAAAVIVAINPGQQFAQARNSTRRSHMNSIANAVYSYSIEHGGTYPDCITETAGDTSDDWSGTPIGNCFDDAEGTTELVDYMSQAPEDPQDDESYEARIIDGNSIELTSTADEWDNENNIVQ